MTEPYYDVDHLLTAEERAALGRRAPMDYGGEKHRKPTTHRESIGIKETRYTDNNFGTQCIPTIEPPFPLKKQYTADERAIGMVLAYLSENELPARENQHHVFYGVSTLTLLLMLFAIGIWALTGDVSPSNGQNLGGGF